MMHKNHSIQSLRGLRLQATNNNNNNNIIIIIIAFRCI